MSRSKRRLLTFVASFAFVFGLAAVPVKTPIGQLFGPAAASAACNSFTVYSDANRSGFRWNTCADQPDLRNNQATTLGWCAFLNQSWDDCISSVQANFSGNTQVCLWSDLTYTGSALKVNPGSVGWWNMPGWLNDQITSIEFSTSDCFAAGNQS